MKDTNTILDSLMELAKKNNVSIESALEPEEILQDLDGFLASKQILRIPMTPQKIKQLTTSISNYYVYDDRYYVMLFINYVKKVIQYITGNTEYFTEITGLNDTSQLNNWKYNLARSKQTKEIDKEYSEWNQFSMGRGRMFTEEQIKCLFDKRNYIQLKQFYKVKVINHISI